MHANLFNQHASKKDVFLHNLRSNNGRYKRYIKAPLRYGGGKSLAVGLIVWSIYLMVCVGLLALL